MSDESYEGWSSRETWAVALHINNDQGWQQEIHEAMWALVNNDPHPENREDLAYTAGQSIKDWAEDLWIYATSEVEPSASLLLALQDMGSLWRVAWTELGEAFLRDLAEQ